MKCAPTCLVDREVKEAVEPNWEGAYECVKEDDVSKMEGDHH